MAPVVFDTFATHSSLVNDVTNTGCLAQKKYVFEFELLWGTAMLVQCFTDEKGWLLLYSILLPHIPVLLMMSLTQAAWHKTAASTVVF